MRDSPDCPCRTAYPSDVTNLQWELIDELLPANSERGRTRACSLREVVNAVNYRWTTGCSWRMLPHDFPHWQTVYAYFRCWQRLGLLSPLRDILISRSLRISVPPRSFGVSADTVPEQDSVIRPASGPAPVASPAERGTSSWSPHSSYASNRS